MKDLIISHAIIFTWKWASSLRAEVLIKKKENGKIMIQLFAFIKWDDTQICYQNLQKEIVENRDKYER